MIVSSIWFFAGMTYLMLGVTALSWADNRWRGVVSELTARSMLLSMASAIAWPLLLIVAAGVRRRRTFPRAQASPVSPSERSRRRAEKDPRFSSRRRSVL